MNLCLEFEPARATLMNWENSPNPNICVQETLCEEMHLTPQNLLLRNPKPSLLHLLPFLLLMRQLFSLLEARNLNVLNASYGHVARNCSATTVKEMDTLFLNA